MTALSIDARGRALANAAWRVARCELERVPLELTAAVVAALEGELGHALSHAERACLMHAYRTELHSLNGAQELGRLGIRIAP